MKDMRLDPIDREIIRVLQPLKLPVTPSKIAKTITVHPATVQNRLKRLNKLGITHCEKNGKNKRMNCMISPGWETSKKLFRKGEKKK